MRQTLKTMEERTMIVNEQIVNENYVLDGITIQSFKEAVAQADLDKVNKLTVKTVDAKDITVYTALLIDDKITRNSTQYNKDFQSMLLSLPVGEGNFIGTPVLFGESKDHQAIAASQVGRIFDAWQVVDNEKHFGVMAKIYILNESNETLISKVDSGVLKELSISTKVQLPLCSVCGQNIANCEHKPGVNNCYVIMSGNGFVAETSFVAVPGSNVAKILSEADVKNFLKLENLKDLVTPMITESISTIPAAMDALSNELAIMKVSDAEMTAKWAAMAESIKALDDLINSKLDAFKETQTTVYPFDMLSALKKISHDVDEGKEFTIKTLAKYNLIESQYRTDSIPDMAQGLRGEDTGLIVKILFDNIEIMGVNMSKIETFLKITPLPTNSTYTSDINDLVAAVRFMTDKIDAIKTRIYKLEGKFNLELDQRNALIQESIKMGIICKRFKFNEKSLAIKFFDNFTTEEIVTLKDEWFKEGSAIYTPTEVPVPIEEPKPKEEVKTKASLKEIAKKITGGH